MANFLFKILLAFNSSSFMLVVYFIKEKHQLSVLNIYPIWISQLFFVIIPMLLTFASIVMKKYLSHDSIECSVDSVELANNVFLPSYLGYFFVGLSVTDLETLFFVYGMVFVFTFLSQAMYYNPLFLFFGYRFYNITTKNNVSHFIISKKNIRTTQNLKFLNLRRINYFTYIDEGEIR